MDAAAVLKGALLPFGGYKGAAIALMMELLAGPLIGERTSPEARAADNDDGGPPHGGEFILVMGPRRFGNPDGWAEQAEALFAEIMAEDGVRLPGDRPGAERARSIEQGIGMPAALYADLVALL